ncbi:hypothetical protein ACHAW6_003616 [Cyclotella cf. meneghiniana]
MNGPSKKPAGFDISLYYKVSSLGKRKFHLTYGSSPQCH